MTPPPTDVTDVGRRPRRRVRLFEPILARFTTVQHDFVNVQSELRASNVSVVSCHKRLGKMTFAKLHMLAKFFVEKTSRNYRVIFAKIKTLTL